MNKSIKICIFLVIFGISSCTTSTIPSGDPDIPESLILEYMDRAGSSFAWYCGSEGVGFRAAARVTLAVLLAVFDWNSEFDACAGFNEQRAQAIDMIRAEREALESGLLDLQTPAEN